MNSFGKLYVFVICFYPLSSCFLLTVWWLWHLDVSNMKFVLTKSVLALIQLAWFTRRYKSVIYYHKLMQPQWAYVLLEISHVCINIHDLGRFQLVSIFWTIEFNIYVTASCAEHTNTGTQIYRVHAAFVCSGHCWRMRRSVDDEPGDSANHPTELPEDRETDVFPVPALPHSQRHRQPADPHQRLDDDQSRH